jgi:hypothetical protein
MSDTRQAAEDPLPRLFTALKVWECRPQSHTPAHYLLSPLYAVPIFPPQRKEECRQGTEQELLRKIRETVKVASPQRKQQPRKGTKTASSSPKSLTRQICNFRASPPLRLLRPTHPFKIRTFLPLFSTRNSLSSTPNGSCKRPSRGRESQRDVGTYCEAVEPVAGWAVDPRTSSREEKRLRAPAIL